MTRKYPKRARSTVFYVPNTDEGRAWLAQARSYLNRPMWQLTPRGRGPRRSQGANKEFLRLELSVYFGIYLNSPSANEIAREEQRKVFKELSSLRQLVSVLGATKEQKVAAMKSVDTILRTVDPFGLRTRTRRAVALN